MIREMGVTDFLSLRQIIISHVTEEIITTCLMEESFFCFVFCSGVFGSILLD